MSKLLRYFLGLWLLFTPIWGRAQRNYPERSVLSTGSWYQVAVDRDAVYRVDRALLDQLGVSGQISSGSIRVFTGPAGMLPEANAAQPGSDLRECAISVQDGGDGVLNGNDYFLFYGEGPDRWIKDSANQRFRHQRHLYSRSSYYYINISGSARRITTSVHGASPAQTVRQYSGRYFHELDTLNFLASGREWYGEEFADAPGKTTRRSFTLPFSNTVAGSPVLLHVSAIARSVGAASRFDVQQAGNLIGSLAVLPTGAGQYDAFAREAEAPFSFIANGRELQWQFAPGSFNAQGWLNWWEWHDRRELSMAGVDQLDFRDWPSVGRGVARYEISQAPASLQVWDVTDATTPINMAWDAAGSFFTNDCDRLREYIAFVPAQAVRPRAIGPVPNQNLHEAPQADYLILYHPSLLSAATRLADIHRQQQGLAVQLAPVNAIYHEFSGGKTDPVALRDFVKMYYDKFASSPDQRPRYLLLLGDASYDFLDRIENNTQLVPAWQNTFSLDVLSSYSSDDFYGYLDDNEDIQSGSASNQLDIGIGRIPARSLTEAINYVDKVEAYLSASSLGAWRTQIGLVADDEDQNAHFNDAEIIAGELTQRSPDFDLQKIYLDAYPQVVQAGGNQYPLVNQTISNQISSGNLIWNYTGHGGPRRLADETILDRNLAESWRNEFRLPMLLTATCDFAPFDNPLISSLGEELLMRPRTGAIALMTTTRIVFSYSNRVMNNNYLRLALERDANGLYRRLGDAVRDAKNFTYQTSTDISNNRKFTLLGDPALRLAFPRHRLRITSINGRPLAQADTLKASSRITLSGEVVDATGQALTDFEGTVYASVFDKINTRTTRGNDAGSNIASFDSRDQVLFRGKATVSHGKFDIDFKVPRDIRYAVGPGRISLYADNGTTDAMGMEPGIRVGGSVPDADADQEGPEIKLYLNDTRFVPGSVSNETPVLLAHFTDSSGINTLGSGIGHDLTVMIDNDPTQLFVLNPYYEAEKDDFQRGRLRYQLPSLSPGSHVIRVKAWDVVNNSNEADLPFVVADDEELRLDHVLNYPNPFTTRTSFWFEHNKPGQDLMVRLQVFTLTGRVIKMMQKTINTSGNRSMELEWDGRDEFGDRVGRGVYLYRLTVTSPDRKKKEKIEKLVIF